MDITSGYFTSAIHEDAIPLTAMVTSFGLYEWLRCPQGAAGAPGHFTRLMALVLQGLDRVQPFIDDIIVHSSSIGQHLDDLTGLFQRLSKHGLKLAPSKVFIGSRSVKFLGHIVEASGIRPDASKVTALLDMPVPKDISALRSWLGLANYYRRFVKGMAKIVAPLTQLMQKGATFALGPEQLAAMRAVNEALAERTLMTYPDCKAAASGERLSFWRLMPHESDLVQYYHRKTFMVWSSQLLSHHARQSAAKRIGLSQIWKPERSCGE